MLSARVLAGKVSGLAKVRMSPVPKIVRPHAFLPIPFSPPPHAQRTTRARVADIFRGFAEPVKKILFCHTARGTTCGWSFVTKEFARAHSSTLTSGACQCACARMHMLTTTLLVLVARNEGILCCNSKPRSELLLSKASLENVWSCFIFQAEKQNKEYGCDNGDNSNLLG